MAKTKSLQHGFTLIELLVVIGILAILLAITLIAINPTKHFQDSRNTQRRANLSAILNGLYAYESTNAGNMAPAVKNLTSTAVSLGNGTPTVATATSFANPNLTFTVGAGNTITSGAVNVTSCVQTADNGTYPVVSGTGTTIVVTNPSASSTSSTGCSIRAGVNLCTDLVPTVIADIPFDPSSGTVAGGTTPCAAGTTSYSTGYTISLSNSRFTISAPSAEGGATISVTK